MKKVVLAFCVFILTVNVSHAKTINICTDMSTWYPFTYKEKGESRGMHVDIVAQALKNLGYKYKFFPVLWDRCLRMTAQGIYDSLVSGSYKAKRAENLYYPDDAPTTKKSKWRIMQVEYVLVTPIDDPYEFQGDIKTLPIPIRAPTGYSIVDDLRKKNIKVITGKTRKNLRSVTRMKKGGVISTPSNARMLIKKHGYQTRLKIHDIPIKSKSYYMLFSKRSANLSKDEMVNIWNEIARLRDNEEFMLKVQTKYN
ncbi:MAG: transporter substrate-binding domain-containing protein [Desulfobacteraceae bacterium]|nr:transporter substrate-binding domain-containing protein [Desulfobacteraceae bacterium]